MTRQVRLVAAPCSGKSKASTKSRFDPVVHATHFLLAVSAIFALCTASIGSAQSVVTVSRGAYEPAVSPDGREVAFAMLGSIWVVGIDGGTARQLTDGAGWDSNPTYSPDGRYLAFARIVSDDEPNIVLLDRMSGVSRLLWRPPAGQRAWVGDLNFHPSASRLLFGQLGEVDIFSRAYSPIVDLSSSSAFDIAPDGSRVVTDMIYPTLDGPRTRVIAEMMQYGRRLSVLNLQTRTLEPIATSSGNIDFREPRWSADGASIIYVERRDGQELVQMFNLAARERRTLLEARMSGREVAVHPDGRTLVLADGGRLRRLDIATGQVRDIQFAVQVESRADPEARLIIRNARLFDGTGAPVQSGMSVEVERGRIVAVQPDAPPEVPSDARVIDANGRFLMPGLVNSHAHMRPSAPDLVRRELLQGVTSIIDPATGPRAFVDLRAAADLGLIDGPHFYGFGRSIDGIVQHGGSLVAETPQGASRFVRWFAEEGMDGAKLYSRLPPDLSCAAIREARRSGLRTISHSGSASWRRLVDCGVSSLTHLSLYYVATEPLPGAGNVDRDYTPPDIPALRTLFRRMAGQGISLDPTLRIAGPSIRPAEILAEARRREPDRDFDQEREWLRQVLMLAIESRVNLLAGTDKDDPLNDELEIYERLGVPRQTILQMATVNGARFLGREQEFGTIEVGRRADLLLVDGDPLTRISDLRNVALVVKEGRVMLDRAGAADRRRPASRR